MVAQRECDASNENRLRLRDTRESGENGCPSVCAGVSSFIARHAAMTYRFGPFLCLVLAGALAIASADTSVNLVWNTNPDCLGPSSGSAQWNNLDDGSCQSYNSTYNGVLYSYITSIDNATCNENGETTYTLFSDPQCNATLGLATTFNTACSPWAGTGEAAPVGTTQPLPDLPPLGGVVPENPISAPTTEPQGNGQSVGSQQFSCNNTIKMKPYVQLIGPGCSQNDQPGLNQWTVTWSNAAGCVPIYNASSISIGFGNMEVTYAQIVDACQPGSSNYSVNLYSDIGCTLSLGSLSFDDGCSEKFNATCFTNDLTAPNGDPIPVEPFAVTPETAAPNIPPVFQGTPQFEPFFAPQSDSPLPVPVPITEPSAASTMTASAFLLVAVAVLAYLL